MIYKAHTAGYRERTCRTEVQMESMEGSENFRARWWESKIVYFSGEMDTMARFGYSPNKWLQIPGSLTGSGVQRKTISGQRRSIEQRREKGFEKLPTTSMPAAVN